MEKLDGKSKDILKENIEKLKEIFPDIVTEGNIDFDKLKTTLGEYIDDREERYNFTWNGKAKAKRLAQTPSTGTLRPCKEESVKWDSTENLFIEGDNLEVLKLLQKSYHKRIKMIYIDPPYNTGNEFVYKDDFKDNLRNYLELTGQVDGEGKKLSANSETSGRYHTDWLNMMYPRLKLARNLLKDDGVIFISIDDNELSNLKKICDEIFGEGNFVCKIVVNRASEIASNNTISKHEYVVVYSKNVLEFEVKGMEKYTISRGTVGNRDQTMPIIEFPRGLKCISVKDGIYKHARQIEGSSENIENLDEIIVKDGKLNQNVKMKARWRSSNDMRNFFNNECKPTPAKISGLIEEIYFEGDRFMPQIKKRTFEKISSIILGLKRGSNDLATVNMDKYFDFPKSIGFIQQLASYIKFDNGGIVLDFFCGSGTTAHSIFNLNREDKGDRKFIMVQLPELCDEKSEAFKAGYKTIAEVGKERIRRVIKKLHKENPDYKDDSGFRVFKLDSSNIKAWDSDFDSLEKSLIDSVDNIKKDRSTEDVLYEILLKYGLDLTLPIEERKISKKTVYSIGLGALIVCLDKDISLDVVEGIAKLKEELNPEVARVVFSDAGFKDDVVKTNTVQILKQHGIEDVKSI